jgi:hypothetical protein
LEGKEIDIERGGAGEENIVVQPSVLSLYKCYGMSFYMKYKSFIFSSGVTIHPLGVQELQSRP